MVTRDERVTARSKLQLGARILRGEPVDAEEVRMAFVCLHCGECTRVCQAILPLVPVWEELEEGLASRFGFPRETVDRFLSDLATNEPFQERLLEHAPTLYESIDGTRRRIDLPLAGARGESAPVISDACDGG
jgi:ferredoxin